jgi:ethanolamine utilization protein EutP (predicted NTPase)
MFSFFYKRHIEKDCFVFGINVTGTQLNYLGNLRYLPKLLHVLLSIKLIKFITTTDLPTRQKIKFTKQHRMVGMTFIETCSAVSEKTIIGEIET